MIKTEKVLVVDVDGTLCSVKGTTESYADLLPEPRLTARLQELAAVGWHIVIHSARNMRTHDGNPGKIAAHTLPGLITWLDLHKIPYHEIHMAKPWPGTDGFYIDDRAVRPREFLEMTHEELDALCDHDRVAKSAKAMP